MLPPERGAGGHGTPLRAIVVTIAVAAALAGCTRSNVIETGAPPRITTTAPDIRPVPNGGTQLPDAAPTTVPTPPAGAATTTATTASSVAGASVSHSPKAANPTPTTTHPTVQSAGSATPVTSPTQATTTTTPGSTTTTTILPTSTTLTAAATPTIAFPGSTQVIQVALTDPQSGPVPTVTGCTGTDYSLTTTNTYVLAPFQTTLNCPSAGVISRTLPSDAPLGAYQLCVATDGSSTTTVCAPYYVIGSTSS